MEYDGFKPSATSTPMKIELSRSSFRKPKHFTRTMIGYGVMTALESFLVLFHLSLMICTYLQVTMPMNWQIRWLVIYIFFFLFSFINLYGYLTIKIRYMVPYMTGKVVGMLFMVIIMFQNEGIFEGRYNQHVILVGVILILYVMITILLFYFYAYDATYVIGGSPVILETILRNETQNTLGEQEKFDSITLSKEEPDATYNNMDPLKCF